jgi:hypothetical protein
MKTRPARKNIQPLSVTTQPLETSKLETTPTPDQAKPSVMDTIIEEHKSRGGGIKPVELWSGFKSFLMYMVPPIALIGIGSLSYTLQLEWLWIGSTVLLLSYPLIWAALLTIRSYVPMMREWFYPTPSYLSDAKAYLERVRKHVNELKARHTLTELRFTLAVLEQFNATFAERAKSVIGAFENLGFLPAIAAGIGGYTLLVSQITAFTLQTAIPTPVDPKVLAAYGFLLFALLYFFAFSRRAAITNVHFNVIAIKQAIAELEAEEKREKEKLEEAAKKNPPA